MRASPRKASEVIQHVRRMRGKFLNEAWEALRDAPGGPMLDAMNVVAELAERPATGREADSG